jgi:hypothetical protein
MRGKKRYVAKINERGRVVAVYTSIHQCAACNFCHPDTILQRVRHKSVIDGLIYKYCEVKILEVDGEGTAASSADD